LLSALFPRYCSVILSGTISALEMTRDFGSFMLDGMIEAWRGFITVQGHMFQLRGVDGISFGSELLGGSNLGRTLDLAKATKIYYLELLQVNKVSLVSVPIRKDYIGFLHWDP